jgi:hypothetical protein
MRDNGVESVYGGMMANAVNDPVARLAKYCFRAKLMHDLLHTILEDNDRDIKAIHGKGGWW